MTVSTRGRYALRVMIDLAEHEAEGFIPLKAITERQNISQKYLEGIMTSLSKAGLVKGAHGKGGGYRLSREPEDYKVSEILTSLRACRELPHTSYVEGIKPCNKRIFQLLHRCRPDGKG